MIDYLTYEDYALYDPHIKPSQQRNAGGMQSKTYRVREALDEFFPGARVVSRVDEIRSRVVMIEPLWFIMGREIDEEIEKLQSLDVKKIIYGSEFGPLRISPSARERFFELGDVVTANCVFLRDLFSYIGIHASHILTDPMSNTFTPRDVPRRNQVVAMGNISWIKNVMQLIEVYKRLEGVTERVYIGSGKLWGITDKRNEELQAELFEHTDRVLPDAIPAEIAVELQQTKVGYWCAYHDTFSSCTHEMLACGVPVVAGPHGLAPELPIAIAADTASQVDHIRRAIDMPEDEYEAESQRLAEWSRSRVSNAVFAEQLRNVIRSVS